MKITLLFVGTVALSLISSASFAVTVNSSSSQVVKETAIKSAKSNSAVIPVFPSTFVSTSKLVLAQTSNRSDSGGSGPDPSGTPGPKEPKEPKR
jgi:hypothetical protein